MKIDLLLFDVDGTILDSSDDLVLAANLTLAKAGHPKQTKEEIMSYVGFGFDVFMSHLCKKAQGQVADTIKTDFVCFLEKQKDTNVFIFDGVKETLDFFKDKKKGVITNRSQAFAVSTLKNIGLYDLFDLVSGVTVPEKIKPNPFSIEYVLGVLGIQKDRVLMIGDMIVDIQAGKKAGVSTCAVSYGLGTREDLLAQRPSFLIDDIRELMCLVQ
jgi:HAD superfamily hydrolase (TIGR01549 family)